MAELQRGQTPLSIGEADDVLVSHFTHSHPENDATLRRRMGIE